VSSWIKAADKPPAFNDVLIYAEGTIYLGTIDGLGYWRDDDGSKICEKVSYWWSLPEVLNNPDWIDSRDCPPNELVLINGEGIVYLGNTNGTGEWFDYTKTGEVSSRSVIMEKVRGWMPLPEAPE